MSSSTTPAVLPTMQVTCRGSRQQHPFCEQPSPMVVRYVYALLFLVANIVAWVLRQSHEAFFQGQRLGGCHGHRDCLAAEGVLIISLACFLFFMVMFLSTVCTRKVQDPRNIWHCQWWLAKTLLLVGSIVISTFAPLYLIQFYGKIAPFGAGVFLVIQLLSVIRYITRFNYTWCHIHVGNRYLVVVAISMVLYIGSLVWILLMSFWYTGCWLNVGFIGATLLLQYLMPLISLKYEAKGFYVGPGLVGLYIVFLCYSAIKSEPETKCYKKEKAGAGADWKTILGFVVALVSTAASSFSTGSEYKRIQLRSVVESEDEVPYGYGSFHFVFATGSMYFGMLFLGWDTHHTVQKWNMDVGWTSTWVHIVNEALAVISFVAILVARMFGIGWLQQLLARIFGIGDHHQQQEEQEVERRRTLRDMLMSSSNDDDEDNTVVPPAASSSSVSTEEMLAGGSNDTTDSAPPTSPAEIHHQQEATTATPTINLADVVAILRGKAVATTTAHEDADAAGPSSSAAPVLSSEDTKQPATT